MSSSSSSSAVICRTFAKTKQCPNGSKCFMMHIADRTESAWRAVRAVSNASLVELQSQRQSSTLQRPDAIIRATSRPSMLTDRVWGNNAPAATNSGAAVITATKGIDRLALLRLESRQSSSTTTTPTTKTELYKTELCRSWSQTNSCPYGSKCQFAHGVQELRPVQRHPKYKTVECNQWAATGKCTFGNRCVFIHDETERQVTRPSSSAMSLSRSELTGWLVSDSATPYVALSANAPSVAVRSKRFTRVIPEPSSSEDDLIKRIQNSFPTFGDLLRKPIEAQQQQQQQQQPPPQPQQQQDAASAKMTTRTL